MLPMPASWEVQDKLSPPQLDLQSRFSRAKRLREGIGLCWDGRGGRMPVSSLPTAAGRGSEQGMLCAGQQDLGPGSGSPEMAARGNLAPRPPRPPLPRGSPALHAGPPRPPACSIQPTKQPQVPAPREVKHPLVWGYVGWDSLGRGWGRSPGSWVAAASRRWAGCSPGSAGSGVCLYAWICACLHTCAVAAGPGSVSPQFGAALGALPGLNKPARGDGAAALLPPQSVRSLPGDTAAGKVAGRWQAGCDSEQSDVMEVSGGLHPPLGACLGDPPLSGALCAGWWAWGMLWH